MLYRVKKKLDRGGRIVIPVGALLTSSDMRQDSLDKLLEVGAIEVVSSPPLAALAGWEAVAAALSTMDLLYLSEFIELDTSELASLLETTEVEVLQWKAKGTELLSTKENT